MALSEYTYTKEHELKDSKVAYNTSTNDSQSSNNIDLLNVSADITMQLKDSRLKQGLSIEDVTKQLNISKKYLIAIEENNLKILPGRVYAEGYLKLYAKFLKVEMPINDNNPEINKVIKKSYGKPKIYLIIISLIMLLGVIAVYILMSERNFN